MIPSLVGVPIKPFGVAKARLSAVLDQKARARLGRAVAARTIHTVAATGAVPAVVTGDPGVARWAARHGWRVVAERPGGGLDGAAAALVDAVLVDAVPGDGAPAGAPGDPGAGPTWALLHADLPLLAADDLATAWAALDAGPVLAPSHDGGTSLLAGRTRFPFAYGPGSFRRHVAAAGGTHSGSPVTIVVRPGLALDLDTAKDLSVAGTLPSGAWIAETLRRTDPSRVVTV